MSSNTVKTASYLLRKRKEIYDRIIRVDHSGELGADRIYHGQMSALRLKNPQQADIVQHLWDQEKEHLREFDYLLLKHRASKSLLTPFWNVGGFLMGFLSAKISPETAMALTVAVEKTITDHYDDQMRTLLNDDLESNKQLVDTISKFRDDEQHHHDVGLENNAERAPVYKLLTSTVETVCKLAIKAAERI